MAKEQRRLFKAVEKFRKNAEKELERARTLSRKSEKLASRKEPSPATDRFFERVRQKELQLSGEIAWANQFLDEIGADGSQKGRSKSEIAAAADSQ